MIVPSGIGCRAGSVPAGRSTEQTGESRRGGISADRYQFQILCSIERADPSSPSTEIVADLVGPRYVRADNKLALKRRLDREMRFARNWRVGAKRGLTSASPACRVRLGELFRRRTPRLGPDSRQRREPPEHPVAEPARLLGARPPSRLCGDSTWRPDVAACSVACADLMVTVRAYGRLITTRLAHSGRPIDSNGTTPRIWRPAGHQADRERAVGKVAS